jgi:hypothetical protein
VTDYRERGKGEGGRDMRTFPRARRAPSKKSMMPSIMNRAPNDVSPTPISVHPYQILIRSAFVRGGFVIFYSLCMSVSHIFE